MLRRLALFNQSFTVMLQALVIMLQTVISLNM